MPGDKLVRVVLLGLPIPLHVTSSEHLDDLRREVALMSRWTSADVASVPHRLDALLLRLEDAFRGVSDQPNARLQEAITRSREAINLEYRVPHAAAGASRELAAILDEADEACRTGRHLLTLATPPDALRYRQWFLGEFVAQVGGAAPTAWAEHARRPRSGPPTGPRQTLGRDLRSSGHERGS